MNFNLATTGLVVLAMTVPSLRAQVFTFKANVPFPFVVGSQTLPAGTYVIQRHFGDPKGPDGTGLIVMRGGRHHIYKVIVTGTVRANDPGGTRASRLIFTSFNGRQYLNRVCVAGDAVADQLADMPPEIAADDAIEEVIVTGLHSSRGK